MGERDENQRLTPWQRLVMRNMRQRSGRGRGEPLQEEDWAAVLEAHASRQGRAIERLWSTLPSSPRCGMCGAPFGRPGSLVAAPLGYRPSRMNPHLCSTCFEASPPGGATFDIGVLFADLRGFTRTSAELAPRDASALLARFYKAAEKTLFPEAIIDKLIGDEVMALYLPHVELLPGARTISDVMVEHARALLARIGYGSAGGPFVDVGVGLDYGPAFVGNVGDRHLHDFTAVGDVVNTASRLQGRAESGQILLSDRVADRLASPVGTRIELALKGKPRPQVAYRISVPR